MGTVPEPVVEETRVTIIRHEVEQAARVLIAGHEVGAIRRIALYVIVGICLTAAGPLVGGIGIAALFLLATTDILR